jgi:hypothetical protein
MGVVSEAIKASHAGAPRHAQSEKEDELRTRSTCEKLGLPKCMLRMERLKGIHNM